MSCPHSSKVGDNYGMTCADCGEVLEGYGNWGEGSRHCMEHRFVSNPEDTYETCIYCQHEQVKSEGGY